MIIDGKRVCCCGDGNSGDGGDGDDGLSLLPWDALWSGGQFTVHDTSLLLMLFGAWIFISVFDGIAMLSCLLFFNCYFILWSCKVISSLLFFLSGDTTCYLGVGFGLFAMDKTFSVGICINVAAGMKLS